MRGNFPYYSEDATGYTSDDAHFAMHLIIPFEIFAGHTSGGTKRDGDPSLSLSQIAQQRVDNTKGRSAARVVYHKDNTVNAHVGREVSLSFSRVA